MGETTEISVTWVQALAWRMEQHLLDPVGSMTTSQTVRRLGAVLSVDETLAEFAVRTRRSSSQPGDLARAVADGTVIQSFLFRGALHYLTPDDGAMYLALRAASRQWELPSWVEHYGLAAEAWPHFRAAIREALGDASLTVAEFGEAMTAQQAYRHLRPVFDAAAGTLIKPLSWQGDISLGPRRDGRLTLQCLDRNAAWRGVPDLDEAGLRAVISYFRTYGPAPVDHLHYWLGEGLSAGRKRINGWLSSIEHRLIAVDVEGAVAMVASEHVEALAAADPSDEVRLLPGHDQWRRTGRISDPSSPEPSPSDSRCLTATRPHIELFRRYMEQRGLAASTIDRRLATVCGLVVMNDSPSGERALQTLAACAAHYI